VIVADTGALLALLDAHDRHHASLRQVFDRDPAGWIVPWAVLPEVDYLALHHLGIEVELAFLADLADGRWMVEWGEAGDLARARELCRRHRALRLGLVDGVVIAVAERLGAAAIATLDLRHFGAVSIAGDPRLLPRDL
jgi:hypothetical protein